MVNVHGGGFFWLSGSLQCSSPDNLIEYDVVLVTFNYRLNVLGKYQNILTIIRVYIQRINN